MLRLAEGLDMPLAAVTEKFAAFGQSGSGKSYAAMKLAETMLEVGAQIVVLDAVGIWWGLRASANGTGPGFPITVFGGEHGDLPLPPGAAGLVANVLAERGVSAVLDIAEYELPDHKRFVRDFAEAFFQAKKGHRSPVHLFLEEAQVLAPMNPDRDETTMLNRVERLARIGRNYGVGWTLISQRPQDVHTKVRNQAGTLLALRTIGTHERKAIGEWVADKARSRDEAALTERLHELPTGTALVWSPSFLKVAMTVAILPRATFDSSATPAFGAAAMAPATLAPVAVEELRGALASAVEEAAANDPAALRRRIAALERQVRAGAAAEPVVRVERVAVPCVPAGLRDQAAALRAVLRTAVDGMHAVSKHLGTLNSGLHTIDDVLAEAERTWGAAAVPPSPPAPEAVTLPPARVPGASAAQKIPATPTPTMAELRAQRTTATPAKLAGGERKILTVLAQYPQGRTRVQAAILAGYSSGGGGYGNLLGALRSKGLIAGSDPLRITDAGRAALGDWEPLPTGRALLEYWYRRLPTMQGVLLRALADRYPRGCSRDQLGELTGYAAGGGAFGNALGRLRTLELVEGRDEVRASAACFEG